jgi:hypothetical protein
MVDGGDPRTDVIAEVARAVPIQLGQDSSVAGTIARLTVDAEPATADFSLREVATAQVGQTVRKVGRTTGLTLGTVTNVHVTTQLALPDGIRTFSELIAVRGAKNGPFSLAGDSGAPVVDQQNRLIGMVYAGNPRDNLTLVMPIGPILQMLGVVLVQ